MEWRERIFPSDRLIGNGKIVAKEGRIIPVRCSSAHKQYTSAVLISNKLCRLDPAAGLCRVMHLSSVKEQLKVVIKAEVIVQRHRQGFAAAGLLGRSNCSRLNTGFGVQAAVQAME